MSMVPITPPPLSSQSMADLMCTVMVLCRGLNEHGRSFWAYMLIKPSMARAFREACNKDSFNLEDFGTVVEYGEGEKIPFHVQERMERYYGADHTYENTLLRTIETL